MIDADEITLTAREEQRDRERKHKVRQDQKKPKMIQVAGMGFVERFLSYS
jgi:hypothetical protein